MPSSPLRKIAAACIVAVGACFLVGIYVAGLTDKNAVDRDFIEYWAAGQQLSHGESPYDGAGILARQQSVGYEGTEPKIAPNPPIALFLMWPLGFLSPKAGLIVWSMALLATISVVNWAIWIMHGRPDSRFHLAGYLFAPVLACQMAGQIGTFLLLGVVLFLLFHRNWPFVAGCALALCALKPHLFLPLALVLLISTIQTPRRTLRTLAGLAATLVAGSALSLWIDPHAWAQYRQTMAASGLLRIYLPTLSSTLRFWLDRDAAWLQFLPEIAACLWACWYFWTRRDRWSWASNGMWLLLVSVLCAPYSWISDEAVVLPAVLAGVYAAVASRRSLIPIALVGGAALAEVMATVKMTSPYYLWTTPAWFAWYWYATRTTAPVQERSEDSSH